MKSQSNGAIPKPVPNGKVMVPDTGKRGVQPIGMVKPYPPRPVPPVAKKGD